MNKQLVIFDFDGVIADTLALCHEIIKGANPDLTLKEYQQLFEGNIYAVTEDRTDLNHIPNEVWFTEYEKYLHEQQLMAGIDLVIPQLAEKYRMFIVSATPKVLIHTFLSAHNLHSYFEEIFGLEAGKSKVQKFKTLLEIYKAGPQDCVMLTDTLGDILEARAAGIESIAVSGGYNSDETLMRGEPLILLHHPSALVDEINKHFKKT